MEQDRQFRADLKETQADVEKRLRDLERFKERVFGIFLAATIGGSAIGAALAKLFGK